MVEKVPGVLWTVKNCRPDTTTAQSDVYLSSEGRETTVDGEISEQGSKTSSWDESRPFPTMVGTMGRQLESKFVGHEYGEELGRT